MKAPVCRLCEKEHWSWQGHLFPVEEAPRVATRPPAKPFPGAAVPAKRNGKRPKVTKPAPSVTPKPAAVTKATGRPRKFATAAERQAAYRKRKAKAGSTPAGKRKAPA